MSRALHFAALASLCALPACPALKPSHPARPIAVEEPVAINVDHQPGNEGWAVAYRFPSPILRAAFERPRYPLRGKWRVISPPGVQIFRERGRDTVASPRGESFDTLVLLVPELTDKLEKEYPLVIPYSDGSRLLYTGALVLAPCPFEGCDTPRAAPLPPALFNFEPRSGERIVVTGKVGEDDPAWRSVPDGAYVYFGRTRPLETKAVVAVIDAGLPKWIGEQVNRALPRVFQYYAERTGVGLPFRPVVFLSYGDAAGERDMSLSGGSLSGVLQLDVRLGAKHRAGPSPEALEGVLRLVAHESAHLWNGQLFRHEDPQGDWMHEGAAEAFALRALRQLGQIDDDGLRRKMSLALSNCAASSAGRSLAAWARPGGWPVVYACGDSVALATEAAVRRAKPASDILSFWGDLFRAAKGGRYDSRLYFQVLAGNSSQGDADRVEALVSTPFEDPGAAYSTALEQLGVRVARDDAAAPPELLRHVGAEVLRQLAVRDCGPDAYVNEGSDAAIVRSPRPCRTFPDGARVEQLGPAAWDRGDLSYAYAIGQCAQGATADVTLAGGAQLAVPCPSPLPPRPGYLDVQGYTFRVERPNGR